MIALEPRLIKRRFHTSHYTIAPMPDKGSYRPQGIDRMSKETDSFTRSSLAFPMPSRYDGGSRMLCLSRLDRREWLFGTSGFHSQITEEHKLIVDI